MILNRELRVILNERVTSEHKPEGIESVAMWLSGGNVFQCKTLKYESARCV